MSGKALPRRAGLTALVGLLICSPALSTAGGKHGKKNVIEVEVAENGLRFSFDSEHVDSDGLPAYGSEFITEGWLYPAGTVSCVANECNGVLFDEATGVASPEFPDEVLGTWTCRGWHVGDGAQTATGPWVVTTQTFDFGESPGSKMIVTDGFEYSDFNVKFLRAIIGGTGTYRNARGQQTQEFLGWNAGFGTTTSMELRLSKP